MYFSRKLTGMQLPRKSAGKYNIECLYIKIQLRLLQINQAIKNVHAHDIVLIDETRGIVNDGLEVWRQILES